MKGKVKWFDSKKGYGFIVSETGKDVFVHYSGIACEGFKDLKQGDNVSFTVTSGAKGDQAIDVSVVKDDK